VCGETGQWRDFGIACQPRGLWRRSGHSTQPLRVMPQTRGRAAGRWRCPRPCGGGREPQGDQRSRQTTLQVWRAVCAETCKHGFGEGRLVTCRKVMRWPPTLLTSRKVECRKRDDGEAHRLIRGVTHMESIGCDKNGLREWISLRDQ